MPKKPKPRRGRPPLPPEELLGDPIPVRVRPAEREAFEVAAREAGLPLSAWIRETLLEATRGSAE